MIVIAINKKKSLDMFKSQKKNENINDFLNYGKFLSKRKCLRGGRTDSQSSLSSFYNIDESVKNLIDSHALKLYRVSDLLG